MQTKPLVQTPRYSYQTTLEASEKVNWTVEDLIGGDKQLDFSRPFLPESLARVEGLEFLTTDEKRVANQIRGHGYLYTFGLVEEFILPFIMDHARTDLGSDDYRTRAFLAFASEEAKHIHLFKRFREEFQRGFGQECEVIGPPEDIAQAVLASNPVSVALLILHIEWMTQRHYVDSVRDDQELDPQFKSLLRHHWMEEAQHAKLDTNMILELTAGISEEDAAAAVDGYLQLGGVIDDLMKQQADFDLQALERATGASMNEDQRAQFLSVQHQALRWTYIGTGITHPEFLSTVEGMSVAQRQKLEEVGPMFC